MGLRIKKGDTVRVILGHGKGSVGRVLAVFPKKGKALVEGYAMVTKHTKPRGQVQGGRVQKESPVPISRLMLVDPKNGEASRFSNKVDESGNKVRISKKSGNEI